MCSVFLFNSDISEILKFFPSINNTTPLQKGKFYPGSKIPCVYKGEALNLSWGFSTDTLKEPLVNIRAESVASKPWFRKYFYKNRCLVAADAFYEWKESEINGKKIPYRFSMKDNSVFFMAGLVNEENSSCAVITTSPCFLVKSVHNRMPVILRKESLNVWADNSFSDTEILLPLLTPYDSSKMYMAQTDM